MRFILNWVIYAVAIIIAAYILPGVTVSGFVAALVVAVVLGAINAFLKPILIVLTLPINLLTLGLFTFVLNALLVMLASSIVPGFGVSGFFQALLFSIVLTLVVWVLEKFKKE